MAEMNKQEYRLKKYIPQTLICVSANITTKVVWEFSIKIHLSSKNITAKSEILPMLYYASLVNEYHTKQKK